MRRQGFARSRLLVSILALAALAVPATAAAAPLPDGRAYEMVSPVEKGGHDVNPENGLGLAWASPSGESVGFGTNTAFPGAISNGTLSTYRSTRGSADWAATLLNSEQAPLDAPGGSELVGFSEDLAASVQRGSRMPQLTPDAAPEVINLYLRDSSGFHLITVGAPAGNADFQPQFRDGSASLDRIVFSSLGGQLQGLTPPPPAESPLQEILYQWDAATGRVSLVGILPDGSVAPGSPELAQPPETQGISYAPWRPVSADGSIIYWSELERATPQDPYAYFHLYARIDNSRTVDVAASQASVPDPLGPKAVDFRVASRDGKTVFFTSAGKLTDDATTGPADEGSDLYRYELGSGKLTDVTVDSTDLAGAQVQGVLGSSTDGSRVYLVARGVLAPGATAGADNLYLWSADDHGGPGSIEFVSGGVGLANYSNAGTGEFGARMPSRVTGDGMHVLFESTESLTGYPNAGHYEAFLYDAATKVLRCATCNPAGTPATANAEAVGAGEAPERARVISEDGRFVFFTTTEQLVPQDTNAVADTYEYDARNDTISLLSSGTSSSPSPYADSSADGRDVFFATRSRLVGVDVDNNYDVYDARIGGGLAGQNAPVTPAPCLALACRAAVPAGAPVDPASATVRGPGDLHGSRCKVADRQAKRQAKRAKDLRKRAGKSSGKRAKGLRRQAKRANAAAQRASKQSKSCRRGGGAGGK